MKKWILNFVILVILSASYLFETGAMDFNDFFMEGPVRSIENDVREVFIPPANTNDSIQYRLYTRSSPKEACFIEPTPEEFDHCAFDPSLETKLLIHGYMSTPKTEPSIDLIKDALLKQGSYNVILVDWSRYNNHPYPTAVLNTVPVAKRIVEFIKFIKKHTGARYSSFHLIGHSLGAHISGIVGKRVCNIRRITGLDPAGPLYELKNKDEQLDYSDAKFVDVIHSSDEMSGEGLGKFEPIGHMDFYPNGGRMQELCERATKANASGNIVKTIESPFDVRNCNHVMALKFFLHSIGDCDYTSTKCDDYERLPICSSEENTTARMGFFAKRIDGLPVQSKFYIKTSGKKPFC